MIQFVCRIVIGLVLSTVLATAKGKFPRVIAAVRRRITKLMFNHVLDEWQMITLAKSMFGRKRSNRGISSSSDIPKKKGYVSQRIRPKLCIEQRNTAIQTAWRFQQMNRTSITKMSPTGRKNRPRDQTNPTPNSFALDVCISFLQS